MMGLDTSTSSARPSSLDELAGRLAGDAAMVDEAAEVAAQIAMRFGEVGPLWAGVRSARSLAEEIGPFASEVRSVASAFRVADQLGALAGGALRAVSQAHLGCDADVVHRSIATNRQAIDDRLRAGDPVPGWMLQPDPVTGGQRQFLDVDFGGDGRVVELFGSLDAPAVAVYVPGRGTTLANFDGVADTARRIWHEADPCSTAVIAWLWYDAPDSGFDFSVLGSGRAEDGARALARFVDAHGLGDGTQRLTVIGHSYGSVVVGQALSAENGRDPALTSDAVVVMGSPGIGVGHPDELAVPPGQAFTLENPADPIAASGWFGVDPNRAGSGFERLSADGWGHSGYVKPESVGLANVAAVVAGRGELERRGRSLDEHIEQGLVSAVDVGRDAVDSAQDTVVSPPLKALGYGLDAADLGLEVLISVRELGDAIDELVPAVRWP